MYRPDPRNVYGRPSDRSAANGPKSRASSTRRADPRQVATTSPGATRMSGAPIQRNDGVSAISPRRGKARVRGSYHPGGIQVGRNRTPISISLSRRGNDGLAAIRIGTDGIDLALHRDDHDDHYDGHHYRPRHRFYYSSSAFYGYPVYGLNTGIAAFGYFGDSAAYYNPYSYGGGYGYPYSSFGSSYLYGAYDPYYDQSYPADSTQQVAPLSPTSTTAAPVWTPSPTVRKGNEAYRLGDYDEARRLYIRGILDDPDAGVAELFYGLAHFATGDYQVAARVIRRAITQRPELMDAPPAIVELYVVEAILDAQLDTLRQVTRDDPTNKEAAFLFGYLAYAAGRPDEALDVIAPLVQRDPTDTVAYLLRDACERVLGPPASLP